jgi:putative Holliday junction resolvase
MQEQILLGFDFGTKRIGVAVGQTVTQTARPLTTVPAKEGVPQQGVIQKIIKTWQPDALVVGVPCHMDGSEQAITRSARQFIVWLKQEFQLPVYEMDERLSTKDARRNLFQEGGFKALQDGQVDRVAAQLILQNWLDQQG